MSTKLPTDVQVVEVDLWYLPVTTRVPLKFGPETLTSVTCARVRIRVVDSKGRSADGWGETPLSVQWVWPSALAYSTRHNALKGFCRLLARNWSEFESKGHPIELGYDFQHQVLPRLRQEYSQHQKLEEDLPYLAALVCCSPFDIALHDAYGNLLGIDVYQTYSSDFMRRDLADFLEPAAGSDADFSRKSPSDFLVRRRVDKLAAWHLVGGLDPIDAAELTGDEPGDGYPVLLGDWIETDGLNCLKIKLKGNDPEWDYARLVKVGRLAEDKQVDWLTADFNCTVNEPEYVNAILDRLKLEWPRVYGMLLYVEQPFPYDLENHRIDVHSVSARKPLFMDESAHDWQLIRLGRSLGWSGVALKTCKTQTGAILSACWAKAHGMTLMVQDLTNPMLAQIPHVLLAAHVDTIMGVETNSMQFYPDASKPESLIHPGLYRRRGGMLDLSTIRGSGFGYRLDSIRRALPEPESLDL
ncbi:MAG: mandelate racemase/muconate lactonizing enzyme family protein [Acidobacteriota bacterium]|nr:MAG: mandelate racemase/muconate lactonizing enzyme family protein [Acidobacteriota bacterium]